MIPFIVLSRPRSGTQLLSALLRTHPDVTAHGEVLNHPPIDNRLAGHTVDEDFTDSALIYQCWRRTEHVNQAAVGVTIMMEHLTCRPFTLPTLLQLPAVHVIVLERANQLERLRSVTQAGQMWRWDVETPPPDLPAVRLPPMPTLRALQESTMWHSQLAQIPNWMTWIYYEDLIVDHNPVMDAVWRFLEVDNPGPLTPSTYRQETRPLCDTITNYHELADTLAPTRYAHLLEAQP